MSRSFLICLFFIFGCTKISIKLANVYPLKTRDIQEKVFVVLTQKEYCHSAYNHSEFYNKLSLDLDDFRKSFSSGIVSIKVSYKPRVVVFLILGGSIEYEVCYLMELIEEQNEHNINAPRFFNN